MREFSILGFVEHLGRLAVEQVVAEHEGLERAARIVEKEAKAEIGTYQDEVAGFVAWAELADATKADRTRQGYSENEPLLRDGTLRDSIEHQVGEKEAVVGSNLPIAEYQELGTERIPPRSFLAGAAARKTDEVVDAMCGPVVMVLAGESVFGGRLPIEP